MIPVVLHWPRIVCVWPVVLLMLTFRFLPPHYTTITEPKYRLYSAFLFRMLICTEESDAPQLSLPEAQGILSFHARLLHKCNLSVSLYTHRVSQQECARLRESVPYVKVYRYNPKHLYPKLNGYGDNGQRSLKL